MKLMTLNTHSLSECDEKNKLQTIANFILNYDVGVVFPRSMVDVYENPFYLEIVRGISYMCNKGRYSLHIITW